MEADEFIALYRGEAEAVLVFLTRRTFDAELAVELTAETFAEGWRSRKTLRGTSSIEQRAWLFTIARRRWAGYLERGRVERGAMRRLGMQLPAFHEDDLDAVDERAGLPALRAELAGVLTRLSDEQQRALQLRVVQELPYCQVARELGVSEQTARARVSRGLRALARALEPGSTTLEPEVGR